MDAQLSPATSSSYSDDAGDEPIPTPGEARLVPGPAFLQPQISPPMPTPPRTQRECGLLNAISNWCQEKDVNRPHFTDAYPWCPIHFLLDGFKVAIGTSVAYNTLSCRDVLARIDLMTAESWQVRGPECFLLALYGLLRLTEVRPGRYKLVKAVMHGLEQSVRQALNAGHPMALLFTMARDRALSIFVCRSLCDIVMLQRSKGIDAANRLLLDGRLMRYVGLVWLNHSMSNQSMLQHAEAAFRHAYALTKSSGDVIGKVRVLQSIARACRCLNNLPKAKELLGEAYGALKAAKKLDTPLAVKVLHDAGFVNERLQRLDAGADCYREALRTQGRLGQSRADVASTVRPLAEVLTATGRLADVEQLSTQFPQSFKNRR